MIVITWYYFALMRKVIGLLIFLKLVKSDEMTNYLLMVITGIDKIA